MPQGATRELQALLRGIPKPQTDSELEIVSAYYFGAPVHLRTLRVDGYRGEHGGAYEVSEDFDSYDPFKGEYDAHRIFWNWACGTLGTGGTARSSYGQFRCGYRQRRRLERWILSRHQGGGSPVREVLAKVSRAENGLGVNTLNRCRGVLIDGRVDGASDSFSSSEAVAA